ncbi:unnamed protein product [marine sediment metagenome]|uniref:DUF883 domain-containing protein n=1 Tax=marine sediment metagenome TaxID=412755 RepID=X1BEY7_9ZZZZ
MVDIKKKGKEIKEKVKEKAEEVDEFVKKHPYKTLGIVAGVSGALGVIAGWFLGRRKK